MSREAVIDLGYDPSLLPPPEIVEKLDMRVAELVEEVKSQPFFRAVLDPSLPLDQLRAVLREVYLEIAMYQEDIIEASTSIIGQMPRSIDVTIIEELLHHQAEEFNHGEMAVSDYVGLGGDESFARSRRYSPSAFAVAAVRRMMVHKRDWAAWLGALYVVETSTPILTGLVRDAMRARGIPAQGSWFIDHHATADLEHSDTLKDVVLRVAEALPEAKTGLCYGPEYYLMVYPLASWRTAYERALSAPSDFALAGH